MEPYKKLLTDQTSLFLSEKVNALLSKYYWVSSETNIPKNSRWCFILKIYNKLINGAKF